MGKRLRPGFSAGVKTTKTVVTPTAMGPVGVPEIVHIESGGELPDDLAEGEEERLARLGAFTPVPSLEERVRAQGAVIEQLHATAPEGEEVTTPGVRPIVDDELPPPPPLEGPDSPAVRHATAPEGEEVVAPVTTEERFDAAQEQAADPEPAKATVEEHAKARRAAKKSE